MPPPTGSQTIIPSPTGQPTEGVTDPSSTWLKVFNGPGYGAFLDAILVEDDYLVAVGSTNHLHMPPYSGDALLMKLTLEGDVLWERTWGGDGYEQAHGVAQAEDGGYYIFGETDSYGAGGRDFFLLKVDQNGAEDWYSTYGREHREWPYGMLKLENGDLLLYGFTEPTSGRGREQYVLRLDPEGKLTWEYIVGVAPEELVSDALETPEGDLVLAVIAGEDGMLVKLDAGGEPLWSQYYDLEGWQFASQVSETSDGGYFLSGFFMQPNQQADTWLARTSPNGELIWESSFGESGFDDYANSMIQLADGTYLLGGIANGILLSRVDEDGNLLWRQSYGGQDVYGAMALLELSDGSSIAAGMLQITPGRSYDAVLLRTRVGE
jgi:hypothetical protein